MENTEEPAEIRFGRRVKAIRTDLEMTQEVLARRVTALGHPMQQSTITKLERGVRPTSVGEVAALASALETDPASLFEDPNRNPDDPVEAQLSARLTRLLIDIVAATDRLEELFQARDRVVAELEEHRGKRKGVRP